ncbi:MAG: hypothetical protein WBB08_10330 [Halobacteriota archaeon]
MIYEYIEDNPPEDFSESVDGYFRVIKIEQRKLWLEDYIGCGGALGPVSVSTEISSMCKEGWVIYLELGKTSKGWQMLVSGSVYPK